MIWKAPVFLRIVVLGLLLLCHADPVGGVRLSPAAAATIEIYYAPEYFPGHKLVSIYDCARRYIFVAIYGITFPPAVKALVSAKKRGVDVRGDYRSGEIE